jgi:hypothetical protein
VVKTQLVISRYAMVLIKQHVSAYSEAIIRFTSASYRRLITMKNLWLDVEISSSTACIAIYINTLRSVAAVSGVSGGGV